MIDVPAFGSTSMQGTHIDAQRIINLYPVDTKGQAQKSVPGIKWWASLDNDPVRGFTVFKERMVTVAGNAIYSVSQGGSHTVIGNLSDASGRVLIINSGLQVLIIDNNYNGYIVDGSFTVTQVSDPDFPEATTGTFGDGFAILNKETTGEFYINTAAYDFTAWSALDFATAEAHPDNITHIDYDKSLLWVWGSATLEIYQNTGNSDFPYEPVRSLTSQYGALPHSVQRLDNTFFWLSQNEDGGRCVVRLVSNADPAVISDSEINDWLDSLPQSEYENVQTEALFYRGRSWYLLTFPTADTYGRTLVFDAGTGAVFEWSRLSPAWDTIGHAPWLHHIYFNGKHIVGDWDTGDLYTLEGTNNNGTRIVKERTFQSDSSG